MTVWLHGGVLIGLALLVAPRIGERCNSLSRTGNPTQVLSPEIPIHKLNVAGYIWRKLERGTCEIERERERERENVQYH